MICRWFLDNIGLARTCRQKRIQNGIDDGMGKERVARSANVEGLNTTSSRI